MVVDIGKEVFDRFFHSLFLEDVANVGHKTFHHQIHTGNLMLVFHPQMMVLVEIKVVVPFVFGQGEDVFLFGVNVYKGVAIVEVDVSDGADKHTSCLST